MNTMKSKLDLPAYILEQCSSGDWESVASIEIEQLADLSSRDELAIFVGVAKIRSNEEDAGRSVLRRAREWGASANKIARVLLSSVHNHIARANIALEDPVAAVKHLSHSASFMEEKARLSGFDASVHYLVSEVRLGHLQDAFGTLERQLKEMTSQASVSIAHLTTVETEIGLLRHELSLAQRRGQLEPRGIQNDASGETRKDVIYRQAMSQLGQDSWVLERTQYKRNGFFVEFGATDGVLLSNTWLLENEFSWQGICAEPNPEFFEQLRQNRSCIVSDACIGESTGDLVEFVFAGAYGGQTKFSEIDQHYSKRRAYIDTGRVAQLSTISLHDLLILHSAPKDIDYISIDVEGGEYDVLKSFPFCEWNVKLLTIEHNFSETRSKVRELLTAQGYKCTEAQWDDWYEKTT